MYPITRAFRRLSPDRKVKKPLLKKLFPEITEQEAALLGRIAPFTLTSPERQWALLKGIEYLNASSIAGDIVECGVWRGGSAMLAKTLCRSSGSDRTVYLFDTFAGMTAPTAADISVGGLSAQVKYREKKRQTHTDWSFASLEEVRDNFKRAGLLDDRVVFVKGMVEQTLRNSVDLPERIALLRLDTDFYESTKVELEVLYPRLVSGGLLIIDDYGHWQGARKATDEYFAAEQPFFIRIDYTARLLVKR
jgi:hypothetical protein